MECNKDEAIRAKEIAEKKFSDNDYVGAKKFILKAQKLYPELQGVVQLQAVCDVHISASKRISSGEVDWYNVLGVNPWADDETIRKQYRKLILMLHPDKNKALGADSAFQLVSQAWGVLSDKAKRIAYNEKLNPVVFQHRMPNQSKASSAGSSTNSFRNFNVNITPDRWSQNESTRSSPPVPPYPFFSQRNDSTQPSPPVPPSFSNQRQSASTQSGPSESFAALNQRWNGSTRRRGRPAVSSSSTQRRNGNTRRGRPPSSSAFIRRRNENAQPGHSAVNQSPNENTQPEPSGLSSASIRRQNDNTRPGPSAATSSPIQKPDTFWTLCIRCSMQFEYLRVYLNHNLLCPNCHEGFLAEERAPPVSAMKSSESFFHLKSQNSQSHAANGNPSDTKRNVGATRISRPDGFAAFSSTNSADLQGAGAGSRAATLSAAAQGKNVFQQSHVQVSSKKGEARAASGCERNFAGDFTPVVELLKKRKSAEAGLDSFGAESRRHYSETERVFGSFGELSLLEVRKMLMEKAHSDIGKHVKKWCANEVNQQGKQQKPAPMSMNVPDPDFHNFDLDRTEHSFGDDQVWAAYDENDGMPRYYARIYEVLSLNLFKMKISWLNSRSCAEFSTLDWVGSGFPKTCGDFRAGKHEISKALNTFSHKVKWAKGARGTIRILPREGDVWALYRNWSPDWSVHTPDEVVHKYDMVEVLDDYDDEQGVSVIPLIKVAGFKTVFCRHTDPDKAMRIPKEEMFRFSHQVPDHLLTGKEGANAPKGCRELDPAATPLELLQVVTEDNKTEMMEASLEVKEEGVQMVARKANASEAKEGKEANKIEMMEASS